MMQINIQSFTFNAFQENTYLLFDAKNQAIVVDPGCSNADEEQLLLNAITSKNLELKAILNTHCHIDHVFGNAFLKRHFDVAIYTHRGELQTLEGAKATAEMFGFKRYEPSPLPTKFVEENDILNFGDLTFNVLFVPGHSIAHIAFYNEENHLLLGGDVLFKGSFGRYDLPGGNLETLKASITEKFFALPNETIVYSGHGPITTIGEERTTNPILMY